MYAGAASRSPASSPSTVCIAATSRVLFDGASGLQHLPASRLRVGFERRERLSPARREGQQGLPTVLLRLLRRHEAAGAKVAQDPAEIAGVEPELARDVARGQLLAAGQFVEHARLGEREPALPPAVAQHADVLRVEPVEAPHRGDALVEVAVRHDCHHGRCDI